MLAALALSAALSCAAPAHPPARAVGAAELLNMRDISGLSVSPDGALFAVQIQQADYANNNYRSVWCVGSTSGGALRAIGDGGGIILPDAIFGRRSGMWLTLAARWAPDSRRFAVLARHSNHVGIAVCDAAASRCDPIVSDGGDVQDLIWSADGRALIYLAAAAPELLAADREREAGAGYLFDTRFDPFHAWTPVRFPAPSPTLHVVDLTTRRSRAPSAVEQDLFDRSRRPPLSISMGSARSLPSFSEAPVSQPTLLDTREHVRAFVRWGDTGAAWSEPQDPSVNGMRAPLALLAARAEDEEAVRCLGEGCTGRLVEFAPIPNSEAIFIIKRDGWAQSRHSLYVWDTTSQQMRRLLSTDAIVRMCSLTADAAICLYEDSLVPRRVVRVSLRNGAVTTLFDANPNLALNAFLPARRLEWDLPRGMQGYGYLIEPPGRRRPRPLIVVQYRAGGFLRGGVGDEYPVQAFAREGFAVLVLERSESADAIRLDGDDFQRSEWSGLAERRRNLDNLQRGLAAVFALGAADPERVGITGLSDGGESAVFAVLHCRCVAVASVSGGAHDPAHRYVMSEPWRSEMRATGRGDPDIGEDGSNWPELSLALNVDRVRIPLLVQTADRELPLMLQTAYSFIDAQRPFEMYVFPDEYHVKFQPRHRQAIYERNLDWFTFWLMNRERSSATNGEQYERWRALRLRRERAR